jgi:hypothetical protein
MVKKKKKKVRTPRALLGAKPTLDKLKKRDKEKRQRNTVWTEDEERAIKAYVRLVMNKEFSMRTIVEEYYHLQIEGEQLQGIGEDKTGYAFRKKLMEEYQKENKKRQKARQKILDDLNTRAIQ